MMAKQDYTPAMSEQTLMNKAEALDRRRIAGNYGPRRVPGDCCPTDWVEAIRSELYEVEEEIHTDDASAARAEIGDVLANVLQLALYLGINDPLVAAEESLDKVGSRLDYVEANTGKTYAHRSARAEATALWDQAKRIERGL